MTTLIDRIEHAMHTDEESRERQSQYLAKAYHDVDFPTKVRIDECFIALCGHSLQTFLQQQAEAEQQAAYEATLPEPELCAILRQVQERDARVAITYVGRWYGQPTVYTATGHIGTVDRARATMKSGRTSYVDLDTIISVVATRGKRDAAGVMQYERFYDAPEPVCVTP